MGCATATMKTSFIVFNVILVFIVISAAVWLLYSDEAMDEELSIGEYILGALIAVLAILGCFAAIRESVPLTATCAVFLLALAIWQIILTCIHMNTREMRSGAETAAQAWEHNEMDTLQKKYECCGKASAQDYVLLNREIPASCYAEQNMAATSDLFIEGCTAKLQEYYETDNVQYTIASWLMVAFELIGFLLAVFLVINFRNKQRRMQF